METQRLKTSMRPVIALSIAAFVILSMGPAGATWSVVGVDPESGEVGVAVASCVELGALDTEGGFELVALSPGNGAGVSQAWFNPDARSEIQSMLDAGMGAVEIIEAGDRYIVRGRATGTPVAPFLGIDPPTGNSFEITSIDIHRVEDGRIVDSYHVEDWATAIHQLHGE